MVSVADVEYAYRLILGREPESQDTVRRLTENCATLEDLRARFLASKEFQDRVAARPATADRMATIEDHSQNGEFRELLRLMVAESAPTKVIVDVGAHGRDGSNSYDLLKQFGWRGLLIEANPSLAQRIETAFKGLDYNLVACAVSDSEGVGNLSLGVNLGVSSLSSEKTRVWGPVSGSIEVPVRRLHNILDEHNIPKTFDILSLDIEGYEARVLNDLHKSSAYRPTWIVMEGSHDFTIADPVKIGVERAVTEDYEVVSRNPVNLFLRRRA